jgi:hypothetical protein
MPRQKQAEVTRPGLENVFPVGNQWHDRIYYDPKEGKYYDAYSDFYISLEEFETFKGN